VRFYDLKIFKTGSKTPYRHWTSHPQTGYDPAALNVTFDIITASYATPWGAQMITIDGVALEDLAQAQQFAGMNIEFAAGMDKGLPLADPTQKGLICAGTIWQSFGNWQGTDMTLDLVIVPSPFSVRLPAPFKFEWLKGQELSEAISNTLTRVFPHLPIQIHIASGFTQDHDERHLCGTLEQLATWLEQLTRIRFNNPVVIGIPQGQILVYDKTYSPGPVKIKFQDLIGQPVWVAPNIMQMKTALRGDVTQGSIITLPKDLLNSPGFVTTTAAARSSTTRQSLTFSGNFQIQQTRHLGQYRSPDAANWSTVIDCYPNA